METETINKLLSEAQTGKSLGNEQGTITQGKSSREAPAKIQNLDTEEKLSDTQAEAIAQRVNDFLKSVQTDLQIEIHKATHKAIFRVVRKEDQKVIQEIPPRSMLDIEANIEKMVGSLININA